MKVVQNINKNIRAEIKRISNSHYYMDYFGDYEFDEYLSKGVCNIDDYINFVTQRLIFDDKANLKNQDFGCAAFVAKNLDGDFIFARNMDCECATAMVIKLQDCNTYHSIGLLNMAELDWDEYTYDTLDIDSKLTLAAPYSPSDGINEHGLAVAILTDVDGIYPTTNKITLLDLTLPRLILNQAKNVEEAIQLAQNYNLFHIVSPIHYMVADVTGNSAVIEFVNGEMVVTKKNCNYQVVTNFTLYNNPLHNGFGKDRYENIEHELVKRNGVISENDALELLKKNVIPGDEQWSAVYNLNKRNVLISFCKEYDAVYRYELTV
ncbi:linear amide C-N hydrolase [Paludicola sp. MB14-C6]|uniref:linear amide C-N hydrolase n=1 Tax=Paludihabitans sp. MB14-C6 TaxID=3070656 RepID=UPI0027DE2DC4|nr:linear amide C-N hydrolase [Paludicola sp. MB14-C6]WMJ23003.1 linear amide C-N hydrolase [Paludicola sp. MB14-C6]